LNKILIAGVGKLGSSYMQGLFPSTNKLDIHVMDISSNALSSAKKAWEELDTEGKSHLVTYHQSFETLPKSIEIVIVSTNADVRVKIAEKISQKSDVQFWILEKILSQNLSGLDKLSSITNASDGAWVNTTRRVLAWYHEIRQGIGVGKTLKLEMSGGFWGLASNAIHYIDTLSWLTGEKLQEIDVSGLDSVWLDSKRPGMKEVTGTLVATYSKNSTLLLTSTNAEPLPAIIFIREDQNEMKWTINERDGIAACSDGRTIEGRLEFQRQLTWKLVDSIFSKGQCGLATFKDSAEMHRIFIKAMLLHWKKT
jgi:hypothetical protein